MKVTQVHTILNNIVKETLGDTAIVAEDLSNVVDIGKQLLDAMDVDKYVKSLINHIGRVIFVDRVYEGQAPKVLMDGWEYGSVMEKITMELPESVANDSWNLTNGQEYNPNIFKAPTVSAKLFNSRVTYEIDISVAERQVKQSFSNATQLNAFFSMIENTIRTRKTIDYENLIFRTINNFTAATIYKEHGAENNYSTYSGVKAVNLLKLYNDKLADGTALTAENCLYNLDFIKFASYQMMLYSDRLTRASKLFNIGGKVRFTPKDRQHIVMLSEFARAADVYLQADTFHNELTKLPDYEPVTFWQGSGTDYEFGSTSDIHVNIANPDGGADTKEIAIGGILCVMFDRDALGVCNVEDRTPTMYNPRGEFINYFYKSDAQYFNDYNENFVVFFVA